jgi:hypothetical protein
MKQIVGTKDKQMVLISLAELMYQTHAGGYQSTKRVMKMMYLFEYLFSKVDPNLNDNYKYLMGSLYAFSGLLKIEAKCWLNTKIKSDPKFKMVCQLFNAENPIDEKEQQYLRELKKHDAVYFETGFAQDLVHFIEGITAGLKIDEASFWLLMDLTTEEMYDQMKLLEYNDPRKMDAVLSAHFCTKFLVDILQFTHAFFVKADPELRESEARTFYDHRTKLLCDIDGKTASLKLSFFTDAIGKVV